jgi:uncharacterized protein (DUF433 family)
MDWGFGVNWGSKIGKTCCLLNVVFFEDIHLKPYFCNMKELKRITFDPLVMGGRPCIRGMRVTVGMVLELIAAGHPNERILKAYPWLEEEDIKACLLYAVWRVEERETLVAEAS